MVACTVVALLCAGILALPDGGYFVMVAVLLVLLVGGPVVLLAVVDSEVSWGRVWAVGGVSGLVASAVLHAGSWWSDEEFGTVEMAISTVFVVAAALACALATAWVLDRDLGDPYRP